MNREAKLKLLQKASAEWMRLYPHENDDSDSHLLEIQRGMGLPEDLITGRTQ